MNPPDNPLFEPGPRWITLPGDPPALRRELSILRSGQMPPAEDEEGF